MDRLLWMAYLRSLALATEVTQEIFAMFEWINFAMEEVNFPTCILEFDCRGEQFRRRRVSNIIDD